MSFFGPLAASNKGVENLCMAADSTIDETKGATNEGTSVSGPETVSSSAIAGASSLGRDVPVSSVLRLAGIPTAKQIEVMESKIDLLAAKINALHTKLDRITSQLSTTVEQNLFDRIDFQLADIRSLMKRIFPKAMAAGEITLDVAAPSEQQNERATNRVVLASQPDPVAAKNDTKDSE